MTVRVKSLYKLDKDPSKKMKFSGLDSVSSWIVAFGSFWIMFFTMGLFRSYGVLYVSILQQFQVSRQDVSWPFSLCGTMQNTGALLPGILSQYFTLQQITILGGVLATLGVSLCYFAENMAWITLSFGVIYGLGSGLIIPTQPVLLNRCFKKHRASACGASFSGAALGSMLFPLIGQDFLDEYGLNGTFLVFGGLILNIMVGASLLSFESVSDPLKEISSQVNSVKEEVKQFKNAKETDLLLPKQSMDLNGSSRLDKPRLSVLIGDLLTDPFFYFTAISSATGWLGCFTFAMVVVDFGLDQGLANDKAVFLIIIYSGCEFIGRLCTGWLSDSGLVKRKNVVLSAATLSGFTLCLFPCIKTTFGLYSLTGVYGLLVGAQIIIYYVLLADYISYEKLALGVSLAFSFGGMFSLLRPVVVGLIRDKQGRYDELFYILGVLSILGGIVWLLEPYIIRRRKKAVLGIVNLC